MKTKVALGLAICCLVSALVGSLITNTVTAQQSVPPYPVVNPAQPYIPLMSVMFNDDPFRQHGLQVQSFFGIVDATAYTLFNTIPSDKRFILTDVYSNTDRSVYIANSVGAIALLNLQIYTGFHASFESGIPFEPNEVIRIKATSSGAYVTISGYYIDL